MAGVLLAVLLGGCGGDAAGVGAGASAGAGAPGTPAPAAAPSGAPPGDVADGPDEAPTARAQEPAPSAPPAQASPSRSPRPSAAPDRSAPGPAATGEEGEFVRVVRASVPEAAAGRSAAEVAGMAVRICADLTAGRAADALLAEVQSLWTLDAEAVAPATARELVKLAIDTDCPDQAGRVDEFRSG